MKAIKFLLFLTLILSCSDDPSSTIDAPVIDETIIMPLKAGNQWIYRLGFKVTSADSVQYDADTLRVVAESDSGYYLESRTQIVMPNGFYENRKDGLYLNNKLQFKFPISINEECGGMFLYNENDIYGNPPVGYLSRNDYQYVINNESESLDTLNNCYYYFLQTFYESDTVHVNGFTVFKPGIGLVFMDWVDITVNTDRSIYNYGAFLREYKIN